MTLTGKSILITGGTGYFGHQVVPYMLEHMKPRRIIIFSRDEHKQREMQQLYNGPAMRYFIGDVRDRNRLDEALHGVDYVIHAAALKQVPAMEYNPGEAKKTNIDGSMNVATACWEANVKRAVFLSTDKAVYPVNLYGATKMAAEKMWLHMNNYMPAKFNVVRYGNVMGSTGSVLPLFLQAKAAGKQCTLTHEDMTRFWVTGRQAVEIALEALSAPPGCVFVPKCPSFYVLSLIEALEADFAIIGRRPGEKLHETLITEDEFARCYVYPKYYLITPDPEHPYDETVKYPTEKSRVAGAGELTSGQSPWFLTAKELKDRILPVAKELGYEKEILWQNDSSSESTTTPGESVESSPSTTPSPETSGSSS